MCYIGYLNDDSSVAKMATEDIKVWKTMSKTQDGFKAPFVQYYFYPNTRLQNSEQLDISINTLLGKIVIAEGLHAYSFRIHTTCERVITECYIPKGSVYFINNRECVSQNLIFDKSYDSKEYLEYYSHNAFKRFFKRKPKPIYVWKD